MFAALDVKSGIVIGDCMPRHRAKEFLTFLRRIDRAVLKPRDIHIVLDNYATHKTPEVMAWLKRRGERGRDVSVEGGAGHGPFDDPGRHQIVAGQPGY